MSDLVERARDFATQAHQRIDQRRKYSKQPYHVHLDAVAKLVATVSDDDEMIAAAWLHDTVEDTPATLDDIEAQFGASVAELVEELTDVSRPSDGNRAQRKAIDRLHTAQASDRAKTVKLADLIDNCKDITRHDPRFARVFLIEMAALLDVLKSGDESLYQQACRLQAKCVDKVGLEQAAAAGPAVWEPPQVVMTGFADPGFKRLFSEIFSARDIAESLLSFDADSRCEDVAAAMKHQRKDVASIRVSGTVQGYIRRKDLDDHSQCADGFRHFTIDQVVPGGSGFADVIHVLTRHDYCFVTSFGNVSGVICRDDVNKPVVRMWLFGIVTMIEMGLAEMVERRFPRDSWHAVVSAGRLEKARTIQAERQRRNRACSLLDCLQLSDKAQILIEDPDSVERLGFQTKSAAKRTVKELESLRNHLAHAQDIVQHDWAQIARLSMRMEEITGSAGR